MRTYTVILFIFLLIPIPTFSQPNPDTLWTRTYGGDQREWARAVLQSPALGYFILGDWRVGSYDSDYYLIRTDNRGDTIWTRTYGGDDLDHAYAIADLVDGAYVIAGCARSFGPASYNMHMIKIDRHGVLRWNRFYGGTYSSGAYDIEQTIDGGFILAGFVHYLGAGGRDYYVVKTDSIGNRIWWSTYGGAGLEEAFAVKQTEDGGYIIAGETASFGAGFNDYYVVRTDVDGDTLWTRTYGGAGSEYAHDVCRTGDGGYIIAGNTTSFGHGGNDYYLVSVNSVGDTLWTRTYGGIGNDVCWSIQRTAEGGYVLGGYTGSYGAGDHDFYIVKTDRLGDTLWSRTYGSILREEARSVQVTADGGYVLAGEVRNMTSNDYNFYVVKTGPDACLMPDKPSNICDLEIEVCSNDILLRWSPVTEDTSGNPINVSYYTIFMSLDDPFFVPAAGNFLTTVYPPDTAFCHRHALDEQRRFYNVKAVVEYSP